MVNLGIVDAAVHAVQMHESLTHGHLHFIIFPAIISPPSLNRFSPIPIPFIPIFFLPTKPTSLTSSLTARSPLIYLQSYPSSKYLFLSLSHHLPILPSCFIKPTTLSISILQYPLKPCPTRLHGHAWPHRLLQTFLLIHFSSPLSITRLMHPPIHSFQSFHACMGAMQTRPHSYPFLSLASSLFPPIYFFSFIQPNPYNLSALLKKFIHGARVVRSLLVETHSTQLSIMANFLCLAWQTMLAYFLDSVWV